VLEDKRGLEPGFSFVLLWPDGVRVRGWQVPANLLPAPSAQRKLPVQRILVRHGVSVIGTMLLDDIRQALEF